MYSTDGFIRKIRKGEINRLFQKLYGGSDLSAIEKRYIDLLEKHRDLFSPEGVHIFSVPGRTELGGNHTDHNSGIVLAGSVQLDTIAAVTPAEDMRVEMHSEGFDKPFFVNLGKLSRVRAEEGTSRALVRGIASRLAQGKYKIGGFRAFVKSDVLPGSGLSSSAAFEVLVCTIFNYLFNGGSIPLLEVAKVAQHAENVYFGKPCGLMDQIATVSGGISEIDFVNISTPKIEKLDVDFEEFGYSLMVVDTGESHADLRSDYSAIPEEMRTIAGEFKKMALREVEYETLLLGLPNLRRKAGDRAVLRSIHFMLENMRVKKQTEMLRKGKIRDYLNLVRQSGDSSFKYLQNCYLPGASKEQGIAIAYALTENFLGNDGACRVHGGGFAGTVQVYIPAQKTVDYIHHIERVFGRGAVTTLRIREKGAFKIL
jgi:galactokinase